MKSKESTKRMSAHWRRGERARNQRRGEKRKNRGEGATDLVLLDSSGGGPREAEGEVSSGSGAVLVEVQGLVKANGAGWDRGDGREEALGERKDRDEVSPWDRKKRRAEARGRYPEGGVSVVAGV